MSTTKTSLEIVEEGVENHELLGACDSDDKQLESISRQQLKNDSMGSANKNTIGRGKSVHLAFNNTGYSSRESNNSTQRKSLSSSKKSYLISLFGLGSTNINNKYGTDSSELKSDKIDEDSMSRTSNERNSSKISLTIMQPSDHRNFRSGGSQSISGHSVNSDEEHVVAHIDCGEVAIDASHDCFCSGSGDDVAHTHACQMRYFSSGTVLKNCRECPLCLIKLPIANFPRLTCCSHRSCRSCLVNYLRVEIMGSRIHLTCPECSESLHPSDIYSLLSNYPELIERYEKFSVRTVLLMDPDTRWCPAPDCTYAVIASSCAACPELKCERPGCGTLFCYHCKGPWHASQTCDEARRERGNVFRRSATQMSTPQENMLKRGDIKACPRCRTYIVKMKDGSCNHMVCAMCSAQFCWLCLREINDLHYLSPTGCTFWGMKPWTRKKKLLWQVGTLIGAPVGIALIAGLAIPGIIFGFPVFVGRKVNQRFTNLSKVRRRCLTASSVISSLIVSPVLAVMAVGVGVPIMLAYVYGVVPLSLCRNGGCGVGSDSSHTDQDEIDDDEIWRDISHDREKSPLLSDVERQDGTSLVTGVSVNSGLSGGQQVHSRLQVQAELYRRRPSIESGVMSLGEKCNYEEASTRAMAGSQYNDDKSVQTVCSGQEVVSYCEDIASTVALAGSVIETKSLTDSSSALFLQSHACCAERDFTSSQNGASNACNHHIKTADERTFGAHHNHFASENAANLREDFVSFGDGKRCVRATSIASGTSVSNSSHRFSHFSQPNSRHGYISNNQGVYNDRIQVGEGSQELMLMSEEAMIQSIVMPFYGTESSDPHADRFHIRAIFDTMKRIVADDAEMQLSQEVEKPETHDLVSNFRSVLRLPSHKDPASSSSSRIQTETSQNDTHIRFLPDSMSTTSSDTQKKFTQAGAKKGVFKNLFSRKRV